MDLPELAKRKHIFVFFTAGTSGNFICNLLSGVQTSKKDLVISESGNTHVNYPENRINYWGTTGGEASLDQIDESFWLECVERNFNPYQITISHSFHTVPYVRNMLPDTKFFTITADTLEEKAAAIIMLPSKLFFSQNTNPRPQRLDLLKKEQTDQLQNLGVDERIITLIVESDRFSPEYYYILLWLNVRVRFERVLASPDRFDHIPRGDMSDFIKLPFSIILKHDTLSLINIIQQCFNEELTDLQKEYITRNFNNYCAAQNQELINSPVEYYRLLEENAIKKIEELKNTYKYEYKL